MRILHFCSYYIGSKVYKNLVLSLAQRGVRSKIFIPIRTKKHFNNNYISDLDVDDIIQFNYVKLLGVLTRIFLFIKLLVLIVYALFKERRNDYTIVHAHTLYSDGLSAYVFSRVRGVKLIMTVRNTDVNLGFKYYIHYKWLAKKSFCYASKIIFLSYAHKVKFINYFGDDFNDKLLVIPNGVDDFYLNNSLQSVNVTMGESAALYVGEINKNKNLKMSIMAYLTACPDSYFKVIGGTYSEYMDVYGPLNDDLFDKVIFLGKLSKEQILKEMNLASLFIMVSHTETFGLVYVEALSQCLPIVYTQGQGVDGYFIDGQYGYCAISNSFESIVSAINATMIKFPNKLGPFDRNPALNFSWENISKIYMDQVYK